ncbi:phosphatidate cytidylyltransferase [Dokdonella fugitiva]|uniref:Phosphatidate cytidylyltransferase n=1 Tax=Dokdonella fugitiva TaxID=328517 RepID=A0A4R2I4Y3_9GAMM|nr:phosphatidate cytidylyltransferase [Dokdonella fugitiva]TCO38168.1 phosphatidate cytidylyltransferase [Dokdonella fugitiva]
MNLASLHLWIPPSVLWTFGAIVALLVVATIVVALMRRGDAGSHVELAARVNSWWVLVGVFAVALLFRRGIAIGFFAVLSFLALKEYLSLIPTRRADRRVLFWAYLCVPIQYWWVWQQWYHMFLIFIPVWAFLFIAMRMVLRGETKDFLRAAGTIHWGLMTMVFGLSHLAYLLVLPDGAPARGAHGAALLLFVVLLTELNDVLQYIWGRTLGRRKVMESVSPKKTVEGLVGGALTTTLVAFLLAPVLTPLTRPDSIAIGLMIGFGGFLGDVTISAVKRDIGVKDTGTMIPGHGGILDRIDSLLFTAPLFFHFMAFFYF